MRDIEVGAYENNYNKYKISSYFDYKIPQYHLSAYL